MAQPPFCLKPKPKRLWHKFPAALRCQLSASHPPCDRRVQSGGSGQTARAKQQIASATWRTCTSSTRSSSTHLRSTSYKAVRPTEDGTTPPTSLGTDFGGRTVAFWLSWGEVFLLQISQISQRVVWKLVKTDHSSLLGEQYQRSVLPQLQPRQVNPHQSHHRFTLSVVGVSVAASTIQ